MVVGESWYTRGFMSEGSAEQARLDDIEQEKEYYDKAKNNYDKKLPCDKCKGKKSGFTLYQLRKIKKKCTSRILLTWCDLLNDSEK